MLVLAAFLGALATAQPSPSPAPAQIYRRALERLEDLPQPDYIDTTQHWKVLAQSPQGEQRYAFDERVLFDSTARRECVLFVPYSSTSAYIIGRSYFAPDMWLVRRPPPRPPKDTRPDFSPDLSDLKTIAAVVSRARPSYSVTLAGISTITHGGGQAYHLVLRPRSNPWKHNLRELWVNTADYDIVRAVLVGDYRPAPLQLLEQTTVAEDFGQVGPYWVVTHHTWSYRDAPNGVTYHYDATAANMSFPSEIPAWYFDRRAFEEHRADVNLTQQWP